MVARRKVSMKTKTGMRESRMAIVSWVRFFRSLTDLPLRLNSTQGSDFDCPTSMGWQIKRWAGLGESCEPEQNGQGADCEA
jgi:hypothetical protein